MSSSSSSSSSNAKRINTTHSLETHTTRTKNKTNQNNTGLFKLYRKHPRYGQIFSVHFDRIKAIEDAMGAWKLANELLQVATEKKIPDVVIRHLKQAQWEENESFKWHLKDNWLLHEGRSPAIKKIVTDVMNIKDFDDAAADTAFLKREIATYFVQQSRVEFDMCDLQGEDGLHSLRRRLRWGLIFAHSLDGLFELDSQLGAHECKHVIKKYKDEAFNFRNKYTMMDEHSGLHKGPALKIWKRLYQANGLFVCQLGALKDKGELVEIFEALLLQCKCCGGSKATARTLAAKLLVCEPHTHAEVSKAGWKMFSQLQKHEHFRMLALAYLNDDVKTLQSIELAVAAKQKLKLEKKLLKNKKKNKVAHVKCTAAKCSRQHGSASDDEETDDHPDDDVKTSSSSESKV
jgi:hypothetical protein